MTTGVPLFWKSECVGIHVDEAASKWLTLDHARLLVAQAIATWTAAGGQCVPSIDLIQLAPASKGTVDYDPSSTTNENDVVFRDEGIVGLDQGTLELPTLTFDHATGELLDADIEIDGTHLPSLIGHADGGGGPPPDSDDLKLLFAHAIGHFLGFAHSMERDSIMAPQLVMGNIQPPILSADDAAGMCAVYPPSGERPTRDASGRELSIPSTACSLSSLPAASPCSNGAAAENIDHGYGCAMGAPGSSPNRKAPCFAVALALGLLVARARRSRRSRLAAAAGPEETRVEERHAAVGGRSDESVRDRLHV